VIVAAQDSLNKMPVNDAPQLIRVPAWRRLGLQLQKAKDIEIPSKRIKGVKDYTTKRSLAGTSDLEYSVNKKPCLEPFRVDRNPDSGNIWSQSHAPLPGLKRSKKVSFSASTKVEDGNPRQNGISGSTRRAEDSTKVALKRNSTKNNTAVKYAHKSEAQVERPKKSRDALEYLDLFYRSRASWKFNKNRETWLLKHALSADIPSSLDIPLAVYMHGLKSVAARSRLFAQCQENLRQIELEIEDEDTSSCSVDMDDPQRRKAYHDDAVRRFKRKLEELWTGDQEIAEQNDPAYQRWLSKRKRAEILLWSVQTSKSKSETGELSAQGTKSETYRTSSGSVANGTTLKTPDKKKKNRTLVVELSSSSESGDDTSTDSSRSDGTSTGNSTLSRGANRS